MPRVIPTQPNPAEDDVEEMLERIEEMLSDGRYVWAQETLEGIHESISERKIVTDPQRRAIDNIEARVIG